MIGNINIIDVEPVKKLKNVLSRVKSSVAICAVREDTNPDGGRTGNILIVGTVLSLLLPTEANKVNRGELDVFTVKEFNCLGTNVSQQYGCFKVHRLHCKLLPIDCPG